MSAAFATDLLGRLVSVYETSFDSAKASTEHHLFSGWVRVVDLVEGLSLTVERVDDVSSGWWPGKAGDLQHITVESGKRVSLTDHPYAIREHPALKGTSVGNDWPCAACGKPRSDHEAGYAAEYRQKQGICDNYVPLVPL